MKNSTILQEAVQLTIASKIPLFTSLASLTWVLHDYFDTAEDEILYVWSGEWNIGKILFFWVRYYTLVLVAFDAAQIHSFSKFRPSLNDCILVDVLTRVFGVLSLWPIEVIMQIRVYALFNRSRAVMAVNAALFVASIILFSLILSYNVRELAGSIASAKSLPIPNCPIVHVKYEWAQWIPPTAYEGVLFLFTLWKAGMTLRAHWYERKADLKPLPNFAGRTLYSVLVQDNLLYFLGISGLLVFNNVMSTSVSKVPWFSFGPFHAAGGIMTARMLIHLRKTLLLRSKTAYDAALARLDEQHPPVYVPEGAIVVNTDGRTGTHPTLEVNLTHAQQARDGTFILTPVIRETVLRCAGTEAILEYNDCAQAICLQA